MLKVEKRHKIMQQFNAGYCNHRVLVKGARRSGRIGGELLVDQPNPAAG